MDEREIYWISFYNSTNKEIGYNISNGGNVNRSMSGEHNPFYGKTHSKETREKISKAKIGTPAWNKGLTKNNDNRVKKCSESLKGNVSSVKGTVWVNDGNISKMINKDDLKKMILLGRTSGRGATLKNKKSTYDIGKNKNNER